MSARTKARKRALDILFAADVRGETPSSVLAAEAERASGEPERQASWEYARTLVLGVIDHWDDINEDIETTARGWTLARMPAVDRAILRVATWEIRWNDDIPTGVAIAEALAAAKEYSTDDSGKFIHGVLAAIGDRYPSATL